MFWARLHCLQGFEQGILQIYFVEQRPGVPSPIRGRSLHEEHYFNLACSGDRREISKYFLFIAQLFVLAVYEILFGIVKIFYCGW